MIPCRLHKDCMQPCPIETALHLEIQATVVRAPRLTAASRRGGQKGGQNRISQQKFVPKAKPLLTQLPEPTTTVPSKSTR